MSYTLRSSGIATALAFCIAVDSDGTTIKEFVANVSLTIDGAVTVGAGTWKGNSRGFFSTTGSGTTPHGITCTAAAIAMSFVSPGAAVFVACNNLLTGTGTAQYTSMIQDAVDDRGFGRGGTLSGPGAWEFSGSTVNGQLGATNLPTDGTTKFSVGGNFVAGGQKTIYYGLESSTLAQDATGTDTNFPGGYFPDHFGGVSGLGAQPGGYHILCGFNRALTLAEQQSLHGDGTNDWFSTLFNPPPSNVLPGVGNIALTGFAPTVTQSSNQLAAPGVGDIALTGYAPTVTQQAIGPQNVTPGAGNITISGFAPTVVRTNLGTLVIPPLKNNTATPQTGLTGIVAVICSTVGALVVIKNSLTTDGSGNMVINDAAIVSGVTYCGLLLDPSGTAVGCFRVIAS